MIIFYFLSMIMSILTVFHSHPIAILISILMQTLIICVMVWILTKTSWFSFILFLVFLGGLMVLFVYISSLASNEMFKLNMKSNFMILSMSMSMTLMILILEFFCKNSSTMNSSVFNKLFIIFSKNLTLLTALIMVYLLLVLIVAVSISSKTEGPIRNFI